MELYRDGREGKIYGTTSNVHSESAQDMEVEADQLVKMIEQTQSVTADGIFSLYQVHAINPGEATVYATRAAIGELEISCDDEDTAGRLEKLVRKRGQFEAFCDVRRIEETEVEITPHGKRNYQTLKDAIQAYGKWEK